MNQSKGTSPWVWIGCGCGVALLLGVTLVAGLGFFGVRKARELERDIKDPARREAKVLEVLGAETLPSGYYPMMGLSVPFLFEMAMVSDLPGDEEEEPQGFGERGFIFFEMISLGRQQQELRDFFEGKTDDAEVLRQQNINIRIGDRLAHGELERSDGEILWVAHRGNIDVMGSRQQGITTLLLFECPNDRRMRMGIWFGPLPQGEVEQAAAEAAEAGSTEARLEADLELAGTHADGAAVAAFVSGFQPCG